MAKTTRISLTEAKQRLGELVKRTAYGGERIVLEFRGKPQAAIVSCDELKMIESKDDRVARQREVLARLDALRARIAARTDVKFDSVKDIEELRRERDDQLSGLR